MLAYVIFFNTLTATVLLKRYSINVNFPVMFVNVSLAMFLKCFLRFRDFEPHVSELVFLKKKRV